MPGRSFNILKVFTAAVAITFIFSGNQTFAQRNISGKINEYSKVISLGTNNVVVFDATAFNKNDTVLLIQMAGVIITANPSTGYGDYHDKLGSPGKYEFLIINSVDKGTKTVTFTQSLINIYDPKGRVQLVKVPSFREATVSSTLTCAAWDSAKGTGGVLALVAGHKLILNSDIDASGKGFKGGIATMSPGDCQVVATSFNFYDASSTASGFKGEGIGNKCNNNITTTDIYPGNAKGKAPSFSGGGGGNGHYSGGGGGSNYGAAYNWNEFTNRVSGGSEITGCDFLGGAYGGNSISDNANIDGGIFMGGGGGASTFATTPAIPSDGGAGGGIIFILADTLVGNSKSVYATGDAAFSTVTGNAGSGGGGGGGSIIIQASTMTSEPIINANGGNGGDNIDPDGGAGGGGGGGLIWTKVELADTVSPPGGSGGKCNTMVDSSLSGIDGHHGKKWSNLNIKLNGFLFNAVYSARTRSDSDTICSGTIPPEITGSEPAGGDGIYTYQWQKSYDSINWTNVSGISKNYLPTEAETSSVYFQRIVTSNSIHNNSNPVHIIVQPAISGNTIGNDNTICYNQDPVPLTQISGGLTGGDNNYLFKWDQSIDNSSWTQAEGTANSSSYDPGNLTQTHYYRRIVTSGACADTSLARTITVYPLITGNTISSDQKICQGSSFSDLTGPVPAGGSGVFDYKWITSSDKNSWSDAPGINTVRNYNPSDDSPGTYYFRRVAMSKDDHLCRDTTISLKLISYPSVSNNVILSPPQTVCAGKIINTLTGSNPSGGTGHPWYEWQSSPDNSTWTSNGKTGIDMAGESVSSTTYFRRIVLDSVCNPSESGSVKITAYPALSNFGISLVASDNDVILTGTSPGLITSPDVTGGNGDAPAYSWYVSVNGTDFTDIGVTTRDYQPGNLTVTTWYRRNSSIFPCTEESVQKITVLEQISENEITGDQYICSTETPAKITGTTPESDNKLTGGDGVFRYLWQKRDAVTNTWEDAPGTNTSSDYSPQLLNRDTEFRRIVKSGKNDCCSDTSATVLVRVDAMPQGITAGDNITLLPYQFATNLNGSFSGAGEGLWSVVSSDGDPVFSDADDQNTAVSKLGTGENVFRWLVSNGKCVAEPVSVTITVPKVSIPEGFSPNNDGHNDYFEISGLEFTTNELVIINTGGAVVYKTKNYRSDDPLKAWYGVDNNGKQLPEGTYYYLLTITGATDISVPHFVAHLSGFVIIRR